MADSLEILNQKIEEIEKNLSSIEIQRKELSIQLEQLKGERDRLHKNQLIEIKNRISQDSSSDEKIKLFRSLFRGREDVYPKRWENTKSRKSGYSPTCKNEWIPGICEKPKIKCGECSNRLFLPLTDKVIRNHLLGYDLDETQYGRKSDYTIGIYPLLQNEACYFLAADFDKQEWKRDTTAFLHTCKEHKIPAYLEKSRSDNGGHVWIFFSESISAADARKLGAYLLTITMDNCPEISFESYDRFFPNQDTLPSGGFGNLIALPLQAKPREKGYSVFLDDNFEPFQDQWKFLSSIKRMTSQDVERIVNDAENRNQIVGVRMALDDEDEPWTLPPSRIRTDKPIFEALPGNVKIVLGNQLYIEKNNLPPILINKLIRLAAFQNPEFYRAQAMRFPIYGKPRIIACAEIFSKHIGLPRGCFEEACDLLNSLKTNLDIKDERNIGNSINSEFEGNLTEEQQKAVEALLPYEMGILSAATAFGKTVVAADLIAKRGRNTLILVHRRQLMDQWIAQIQAFLKLNPSDIGQIGGGKRKPTGIIDIAIIQSLIKKHEVDNIVANYGHLIVDECHHLSAVSFETVSRQCKAKYVLGLSATVTRKDGHHPIIFMQCGPIRFRVDPKEQSKKRPFDHIVYLRNTDFKMPAMEDNKKSTAIHNIYISLITDAARNEMIIKDILSTLKNNRSPLVITERKAHLEFLLDKLSKHVVNLFALHGRISPRKRKEQMERISQLPDTEERLIIATGRFLGEGFDDPRLDTLFLTMPISWKGTLSQYAGRLHRLHHAKKDVIIYDYIDSEISMLTRMSEKRMRGYRSLGYEIMTKVNSL